METRVSSFRKEVVIGGSRPTVLIGERLNPTGKPRLAAALQAGDMQALQAEAVAQVRAGADVLDVNVGAPGIDEVALLPLIKERGAAVIGLTMDERGIPGDAEGRLVIAHRIVQRAQARGIPREDAVMDCLAMGRGTGTPPATSGPSGSGRSSNHLDSCRDQASSSVGQMKKPRCAGASLA